MEIFDVLEMLTAVLVAVVISFVLQNSLRRRPLPPGPKALPLLGNLFDLPTSREYETYARWGKEYGDVVHVSTVGRHILILNSVHAAKELLDVRSAIYSDRPYIPMLQEPELMDIRSFVFKRYSASWRRQRRLFARHFGVASSSSQFLEIHQASVHGLLRSILHMPEQFSEHLRHTIAESFLKIAYGYQIQAPIDPLVSLIKVVIQTVSDGALPSNLVNIIPLLKYIPAWVPGASFKTHASETRKIVQDIERTHYEDNKRRMAEGTATPSFLANALEDASPGDLISDIREVAETMYGAAAESTVSTMHSCLLALLLNPRIQERAQCELTTVLGPVTSPTFRLPEFSDRKRLPYIDAIVKESLRWLPPTPLGLPHANIAEDVYRGWLIPKGTIVIANAWWMLHDEKTYPDPFVFRPERFLGENPAPHPETQGCFGFGRRGCPGRHLAEASLWIQIASLLAAFTLSPAKDEDGADIDVNYASDPLPGPVLNPQQFPCTIIPRSAEAVLRIRETHPEGTLA